MRNEHWAKIEWKYQTCQICPADIKTQVRRHVWQCAASFMKFTHLSSESTKIFSKICVVKDMPVELMISEVSVAYNQICMLTVSLSVFVLCQIWQEITKECFLKTNFGQSCTTKWRRNPYRHEVLVVCCKYSGKVKQWNFIICWWHFPQNSLPKCLSFAFQFILCPALSLSLSLSPFPLFVNNSSMKVVDVIAGEKEYHGLQRNVRSFALSMITSHDTCSSSLMLILSRFRSVDSFFGVEVSKASEKISLYAVINLPTTAWWLRHHKSWKYGDAFCQNIWRLMATCEWCVFPKKRFCRIPIGPVLFFSLIKHD